MKLQEYIYGCILFLGIAYIFTMFNNKAEGFKADISNTYIFYHIYCNKNTYDIVEEQTTTILSSRLYNTTNAIYCFLVGDPKYIATIKAYLKGLGEKFTILAEGPNDRTYERFTLEKIKKNIQDADKFLYIHTKGVGKPKNRAVELWRKWMQYFLIENYKVCLDYLDYYDIVGVGYKVDIPHLGKVVGPHFSGNFWWSTGAYYKGLPDIIGEHYNDPESYIFLANPKWKDLDEGRITNEQSIYEIEIDPDSYIVE